MVRFAQRRDGYPYVRQLHETHHRHLEGREQKPEQANRGRVSAHCSGLPSAGGTELAVVGGENHCTRW